MLKNGPDWTCFIQLSSAFELQAEKRILIPSPLTPDIALGKKSEPVPFFVWRALLFSFIVEVDLDTYYIFKIVHLTGIFFVFSALGGHMFRAAIGNKEDNPLPKFIGMFHKVGLLIVLLGGIGLLTQFGGIGAFGWIIVKFFVLVMLAIWPLYLYGAKEKLPWLGGAPILFGLVAAFFALYKPF